MSEKQSIQEYVWKKKDSEVLMMAVWMAKTDDNEPASKDAWTKQWNADTMEKWKNKPLHGQYPKQVSDLTDDQHAYKWMKTTGLKIETEALITAAQEQALNTKSHQARVLKTSKDARCRLCKTADETVTHILTGCSKIAQTEYMKRHNAVAAVVHKHACQEYGIPTVKQAWLHKPQAVTETERVKILWDFEIRTDHIIPARRPDMVVIDKEHKIATITDVAVPSDRNIKDKEVEKVQKYQDLRLEI